MSISKHLIPKCSLISNSSGGGDWDSVAEDNNGLKVNGDKSSTQLKRKELSSTPFEKTEIQFKIDLSQNTEPSSNLFLGDAYQFIPQHIDLPEGFVVVESPEGDNTDYTLFRDSEYFGTYNKEEEIEEYEPKHFKLNLFQQVSTAEGELSLPVSWYSTGYPANQLPQWLLENSNLFAKDTINFAPVSQVRRIRFEFLVSRIRKPLLTANIIFVLSLTILIGVNLNLKNQVRNVWDGGNSGRQLKQSLTSLQSEYNSRVKSYAGLSQLSNRRSKITQQIARYEDILPRNVYIEDLKIDSRKMTELSYHTLMCVASGDKTLNTTIDAVLNQNGLQNMSIKKLNSLKSGQVRFQIKGTTLH
ncbi:MAG: hypothetical protein HQ556_03305 [Candidatus Marinimicrobia bacterium]|nr:hypothetical protein [Candidatus Neomarinimicrobiota bacterium]